MPHALTLTPQGHLLFVADGAGELLDASLSARLAAAFERGAGHGLLALGVDEVRTSLPPVFAYWRAFAAQFVTAVCALQDGGEGWVSGHVAAPEARDLEGLALSAPPMPGAEYLSSAVLRELWASIDAAFGRELAEAKCGVQDFLKGRNPAWNLVGRVHFHVAENRNDGAAPFAFLATYTTRLSSDAQARHVPLGQALREYAGAANKQRLLSLLVPVQRAAEACPWLKAMVDAGEIYHPLRWKPRDVLQLLRDVPPLEAAGVVVRMPAGWQGKHPPRPRVRGTVGGTAPAGLGRDALLDFQMEVTLDGEALSEAEIRELLESTDGLVLMRGQWVEVDRERLEGMLDRFRAAEKAALENGLRFADAMRLLAGAGIGDGAVAEEEAADWAEVVSGPWLAETLRGLRDPEGLARVEPGEALRGELRPYQQAGLRWLYLLVKMGLGGCLADDMGLGKTIQVLSLLLVLQRQEGERGTPSLLVAPASLLANWASEIERFAPGLDALVAHPSVLPAAELRDLDAERLRGVDVVITSYGTLLRAPWMVERPWRLAVLDEAQAIKNPDSKQTRAVKKLKTGARIALTGTPVENRVADLWSIFDFVNPGLLGNSKEFSRFVKRLGEARGGSFGPLRELVRPYILRRLKTDKSVIADLPDKTEIKAFCSLSRTQAALYQQGVRELAERLANADGIQRRGVVLAFLMRFKQICNHPSQWLGDGAWSEEDSGKWARLREIAEVVASKQEKMLVFTQFREVTAPLDAYLGGVFGRRGLVLHGETEVKKRKDLVRRFQEDETVPYFVLSLKAGGSGLNLTAASHVVHFDRWWNPAVENQATDRAYRIGQKKNVLVHKFVCRGTLEDRIDELIESKRRLSEDLLEGSGDTLITEMPDDELLKLVALDINKALQE